MLASCGPGLSAGVANSDWAREIEKCESKPSTGVTNSNTLAATLREKVKISETSSDSN